jgi:hypothetical protein
MRDCADSSQCPAGAACVNGVCGSSFCSYCLPTCTGTCAVGTCRTVSHVQVCDPRGATGACTQADQCLSNVCTASSCEAQVANGQPCTLDSECISGACGSNANTTVCALNFGDTCTADLDCLMTTACCHATYYATTGTCESIPCPYGSPDGG